MDCARNIITANFSGGGTSATTAPLWQWDYGQVLCITGIDLPAAFEVHFSTNKTGGVSTTAVGADGQVTIPNVLLTIGKNLNAWIYLSDAQGEGETEYSILIPVKARPMPETYDAEVSGEFDDVVRQVSEYAQTAQTAADNAGASATAAAASASEATASASAAESAKTAAETAQGKAEDAQAAAETAAQTATGKAEQTAQDAAQAAQSKADAESAAGSAEAAQTGAESAKTDAETAAQGAADSASAASASATSAGQAASAAAGSATAAAGSATTAGNAAQTATDKAGEASASASAAAASETAAQTAQTAAETAASTATASATTATTKAAEAAQSASGAAQSKADAEAAETRAEQAAATLTVDSALSDTSVNPVQNKVVTAEFADVKSALNDITSISFTETSGYINERGGISAASETKKEVYTNQIKVNAGDKLRLDISYPNAVKRWVGYGLYTDSGAWMERIILINDSTGNSYTADITIPENVGYIAFMYRTFGNENVASVYSLSNTFEDVRNLETELQSASANIATIANSGITFIASDLQQGEWENGAISATTSRLCTKVLYPVVSKMTVTFNTSTNLNIAFRVFDENGVQIEGTSWLGGTDTDETYFLRKSGRLGIIFKRTSGSYITTANYTTWGAVTRFDNSLNGLLTGLSQSDNISTEKVGKVENVLKPMYDHLFVNSGENAIIPHESLYHVRLSKRLGFNVIEANIARTSDGVYIVNHLNNGAFGTYFHHVDGTTNISTILVSSVTWEWIETNVRYNSTIPKYRTRPCRLEEFLGECKQQGLIPLVMITSQEVLDIVESYMGENNYIAYGGTRALCPDAIIFQWRNDATKANILKYCRGIGAPMIYGMSNTSNFTEAELREIATALHAEGFWLGTSYNDAAWYRLSNCGFDIIGTQRMINRIERGNVKNIDSVFGFSEYDYTGATESDGVLTFTEDGTLSPKIDTGNILIGGADLQIVFDGEITIPAFGELNSLTYTRDASIPVFVTTPLIHKSPRLVLQVKAGTIIYDCTYRVMEC